MSVQPGSGYTFTSSSLGTNLNIEKPWAAWPLTGYEDEVEYCPLEVYNLRKVGSDYKFNVYPGMVNNQVVRSNDMVLLTDEPPPDIDAFTSGLTPDTLTTNYVNIRCGNTAGPPAAYPSISGEGRPSVRVFTTAQTDSDTYSYILIAYLTGMKATVPGSDPPVFTYAFNIYGMIGCNSLWTERFKCGASPAVYWWSSV
jgi:hypothetical protein